MINNLLSDILRILKGKNGTIFLIIGGLILFMFIMRILGPLLWLAIVGGLLFLAFRYFENKK